MTRRRSIWRPPGSARHVALTRDAALAAILDRSRRLAVIAPFGERPPLHLGAQADAIATALGDDGRTIAVVDGERRVRVIAVDDPAAARSLATPCGRLVTAGVQAGPSSTQVSIDAAHLVLAPDLRALALSELTIDDQEAYYGGGWITSEAATRLLPWPAATPAVTITTAREVQAITYSSRDAEGLADHAVAVDFSPCSRWLGVLLARGRLLVHAVARVVADEADGADDADGAASVIAAPPGPLRAFAFVPGEDAVVVASGPRVSTWDLVAAVERASFGVDDEVLALAVAPDRARLALVTRAGEVSLVRAADGGERVVLPRDGEAPATAIAWAGEALIVRRADGAVERWV